MPHAFRLAYAHENGLYKLALSLLLLGPFALILGIAPFDIIISVLGFLFIIFSCQEKNFSWLKEAWVKVFLVLWAYMIVRGFFAIEPWVSAAESAVFIRFALFTLALQYWLLKKSSARELLLIALAITLFFSAADGLIQLFTGSDLLGHSIPVDFSHSWRLTAISGKLNLGAKCSMIALPAIIYLVSLFAKKEIRRFYRWSFLLLAFLFIIFIPLTGERNATLMILLGLALMFFLYKPYRFPLAILLISVALFVAGFIYYCPGFKQRGIAGVNVVSGLVDADPDIMKAYSNPYLVLLKTDWNIFLKNPVFGVGRKQYHTYCEQAPESIALTKITSAQCITNAQNIYLEWLDEAGIIGFSLFISIIALWAKKLYSKRRLLLLNPVVLAALIEIFLRLWPLASTSSFFFAWCGGPFWLMAGWVFAYLSENKAQTL